MPLMNLDRLCEDLEDGDWAGFLRDWDRSLRAANHPETTRYNYLLAAAQLAKYLAAEAAWDAANACIDAHGGYGYAEEYDVERKFREARLYKTAPINNNLVMAYVGEHVLGMPRSY